jgi:peptide/nickel transport system substrate-binding protein
MKNIGVTRRQIGLSALGLAATGLAARPAAAAPDRPLKWGFANSDLGTVDPIAIRTTNDDFLVRQIFQPLVSPPYGTGDMDLAKVKGELAESWEASPDHKVWTIRIRRNVQFQQNYGEVTSDDVKFSFDRVRSPGSGSLYTDSYQDIDHIDAPDRYTVRFFLRTANPAFHATDLYPREGAYVVSRKAVEERGEKFGRNPIGSGAYQFGTYEPGRSVTLTAYPQFFRGVAPIRELQFLFMPETSARTLAFRKGDLDFIDGARGPGWTRDLKRAMPKAQFDVLFPGSTQLLHINLTQKPMDDLRVRQAMAYGLDRQVWKQTFDILHGPLYGMNAPGVYGALDTEADVPAELRYAYDPDRARSLLKQAGLPSGFDIHMYISTREDYMTNALLVQDQWRKIGINLDLRQVDHATYHSQVLKDTDPLVIMSGPNSASVARWDQIYFAANAVVKPDGHGGQNFSHYGVAMPGIDQLLAAAADGTDEAKQIATMRQIETQLLRDLPAIPLQCLGWVWVNQPTVKIPFAFASGPECFPMETLQFA